MNRTQLIALWIGACNSVGCVLHQTVGAWAISDLDTYSTIATLDLDTFEPLAIVSPARFALIAARVKNAEPDPQLSDDALFARKVSS